LAKILAIEDEENLRLSIRRTLTRSGHAVSEASCLSDARGLLETTAFDLILTDVILGSENGLDLVRALRAEGNDALIVVMTAFGTVESAVQAMKVGADDYLQKPLSLEELSLQVDRWLEQQRVARRATLYERLERVRDEKHNLVGASPAWQETVDVARRLAGIPLGEEGAEGGADGSLPTILLVGETGTGKGVLARFIHAVATGETGQTAGRAGKNGEGTVPFVHVNCSALPATLVEGELFGHEKGAFTDAREARPGLFEMADGGTIFLDEISEMPLELQAKLLLVVEQGAFRRVGGTKERHVRVRIIAASNQDLRERVEAGRFRRDLLYRLNTFTVTIPPLRERGGDALLIAETVLERTGRRYGRADLTLSDAAVAAIESHDWPGNVRELVNAVQRAAMLASSSRVEPGDLGLAPARPSAGAPAARHEPAGNGKLRFNFASGEHTADAVERMLIMQALEETRGNVSRAAKLIGMQRSSFRYRIERYRLDAFVSEVARR
jgi:DNA-binding NtrC family response regulator